MKDQIIKPATLVPQPEAVVKFNKNSIVFNKEAAKLLALKTGEYFYLIERNQGFSFKPTSHDDGFKIGRPLKYGGFNVPAKGLQSYLEFYDPVILKIGEFKDGSWQLL